MIPCPYYKYIAKYNEMVAHQLVEYKEDRVRAQVVKEIEKTLFIKYADPNLDVKPKELEKRGGSYYSTVACEVMFALNGGPEVVHAVNIPHNGYIKDLDKDIVIEISSRISKDKIEPIISAQKTPIAIKGIIEQTKAYEVLASTAAVNGDYLTGLLALNVSPFGCSDITNRKIYDDLMRAHQKFLKQFKN